MASQWRSKKAMFSSQRLRHDWSHGEASFLSKNMSENRPKDTLDFVECCFTGGIQQHTWWEWKRLIHAFVGHFMIMDTWGLINKFNKQFTGSLRLTWPFPGAWIGLPLRSIIIDRIKTGLNNGTNPRLTMRSVSIGYHFKDQTNTVAFISKQRWLKPLSGECQMCDFHLNADDEWAPLAPIPPPRGYRPCVLTPVLRMDSLYTKLYPETQFWWCWAHRRTITKVAFCTRRPVRS